MLLPCSVQAILHDLILYVKTGASSLGYFYVYSLKFITVCRNWQPAVMSSASAAFSLDFFTECRNVAGLFVRHKHCTIPVLCVVSVSLVGHITSIMLGRSWTIIGLDEWTKSIGS